MLSRKRELGPRLSSAKTCDLGVPLVLGRKVLLPHRQASGRLWQRRLRAPSELEGSSPMKTRAVGYGLGVSGVFWAEYLLRHQRGSPKLALRPLGQFSSRLLVDKFEDMFTQGSQTSRKTAQTMSSVRSRIAKIHSPWTAPFKGRIPAAYSFTDFADRQGNCL